MREIPQSTHRDQELKRPYRVAVLSVMQDGRWRTASDVQRGMKKPLGSIEETTGILSGLVRMRFLKSSSKEGITLYCVRHEKTPGQGA